MSSAHEVLKNMLESKELALLEYIAREYKVTSELYHMYIVLIYK